MRERRSEAAFESVIESQLLGAGYVAVDRKGFDRESAIFPSVVLDFIRETQPTTWARLDALHGERTGELSPRTVRGRDCRRGHRPARCEGGVMLSTRGTKDGEHHAD